MKKLTLVFLMIFCCGCLTPYPIRDNDFGDKYYTKKDNLIFYSKNPEYYNLKDKITKQEYRRLPSYLQECYELHLR